MSTQSHEETQIREAMDKRVKAVRCKNPDAVRAAFCLETIVHSVELPLQPSAQQQDLVGWFSTWIGPIGYEVCELEISVGGDIAYCHFLSHMTGPRVDDEDANFWFREALFFRRISKQWLITHRHDCVPMLM